MEWHEHALQLATCMEFRKSIQFKSIEMFTCDNTPQYPLQYDES